MIDNMVLVIATNEKQAFAAANLIIGLKRYNECFIDRIYIYNDDLSLSTKKKIFSIWDKIRFIDFKFKYVLDNLYNVNKELMRGYSHLIYAKFEIFKYMKMYKYVLWLDIDMLIVDNINELLPVNVDAIWRYGSIVLAKKYLEKENITIKDNFTKPNGGFLLFNSENISKKLNTELMTTKCYDIVNNAFQNNILTDMNQSDELPFGVIQAMYNLEISNSKYRANVFPAEAKVNSIIIHGVHDLKFWKSPNVFILFQEWFVNHKIWCNKYAHSDYFELIEIDNELINISNYYNKMKFNDLLINFIGEINYNLLCKYSEYKIYIDKSDTDILIKSIECKELYIKINLTGWGPTEKTKVNFYFIINNINDNLYDILNNLSNEQKKYLKINKNDIVYSCKYYKKTFIKILFDIIDNIFIKYIISMQK